MEAFVNQERQYMKQNIEMEQANWSTTIIKISMGAYVYKCVCMNHMMNFLKMCRMFLQTHYKTGKCYPLLYLFYVYYYVNSCK